MSLELIASKDVANKLDEVATSCEIQFERLADAGFYEKGYRFYKMGKEYRLEAADLRNENQAPVAAGALGNVG